MAMDDTTFFYSLLRTPHLLTKEEVKQLTALESQYPFFQGIQLLIAANAEALSKNAEEVVLRRSRAAIALPDEFALFRYLDAMRLNLLREHKEQQEQTALTTPLPTVSSIIANTEEKNELDGVLEHSLQSVAPFPSPTISTLETTGHLDAEEIFIYATTHLNPRYTAPAASDTFESQDAWHPVTPDEQMALINNFLQNLDTEDGIKATVQREAAEEERMGIEPEDLSAASRSVNNSTMERVAKLHESLAEYKSAITVYEKLVQTFPEKSTYFVKEIERLRALLKQSND